MSSGRLIQNLRGGRALIVAQPDSATAALVTALTRLGIVPVYVQSDSVELDPARLDPERDVLLVDGDLAACVSLPLTPLGQLPPAPVVGLVGIEAPSQLRQLMSLGATAFLRKPVHHGSIYSALFLCVNEYHRRLELAQSLQELQHRRGKRRFVIKAVIDVMQRRGVDDDAAYDSLRRESMRVRQSLEDYCEAYVQKSEMLAKKDAGPAISPGGRMSDKEMDDAAKDDPKANPDHCPGWAAASGRSSGAGGRSDQARRA